MRAWKVTLLISNVGQGMMMSHRGERASGTMWDSIGHSKLGVCMGDNEEPDVNIIFNPAAAG